METPTIPLRILGLTKKETQVFKAIKMGFSTPLVISHKVKVSRPAIYEIIIRLKERGLIKSHIKNGKKLWEVEKGEAIDHLLYEAKKEILNIHSGSEEVKGTSDSTVIVHRGKDAIKSLLDNVFKDYKNERCYGFQGDLPASGWGSVYGIEATNAINKLIKKNGIITEAVMPAGWFERQYKVMGKDWAIDFEGRSTRTHVIPEEYFQHGGQLFIFKNALYLLAMNEEVVVEIRNSELQKMILAMFRYVQDQSEKIDPNRILRELIEKGK
ncbi:MAG: hypothetical protein JWN37_183 [Candidatus Nomurabacteria bacterium]|nr:hypothetical protein [Candidatus Nomurabacteria bacterium]